MVDIPKTSHGVAKLATAEEIARENDRMLLVTDTGFELITDSGDQLCMNRAPFGFTHPNLHRRIDTDPVYEPGVDYSMVYYDDAGNPFKQTVKIGVWDGINSYRTITNHVHDEESTTCEIP